MAVELTKNNAMFIHFPKTGGSYVREVLKELRIPNKRYIKEGYHRSHCVLEAIDFDGYKFGIVRSPIAWYESVWKYLVDFHGNGGDWGSEKWQPMQDLSNIFNKDFNMFIKGCVNRYPSHYSKCLNIYFDDSVHVFKTETLTTDFIKVLDSLGVQYDKRKLINSPMHGRRENNGIVWDKNHKFEIFELEKEMLDKYYL